MSKADKMFEELGYAKEGDDRIIIYNINRSSRISLNCAHKEYWHSDRNAITLKEHLAIHEKMKELGWLE